MTHDKPNACPFCGAEGDLSLNGALTAICDRNQRDHRIKCDNCIVVGPPANSVSEAVEQWNLRAAIEASTQDAEIERLRSLLEKARHFLTSTDQESGWCCCGDTVATHGLGSGHSPVDEQTYYANSIVEQIDQALAPNPTGGEAMRPRTVP